MAARSSICSASSFFSFALSSSSAFSRFASDIVMPPNLAFQLWKVPSDMLCLRHRSTHFAPSTYASTMLGKDADNLLVRESRSLHCPSSGWGRL